MNVYDKGQKSLEYFLQELNNIDEGTSKLVQSVVSIKPGDVNLKAYQAEWLVRGLTYHCRNLIENYGLIADDVVKRAKIGADIIIMHAPAVQKLQFEFYSVVLLARISLDSLRNILYPVFLPGTQLPKSIGDIKSGYTNCPTYERIAREPVVTYLIDIRDCIVHYRPFATNDNIIARLDEIEESLMQGISDWIRPMAEAVFRRIDEDKVVLNFYLPDTIFKVSRSEGLAQFTYKQRINMLSLCVEFIKIVAFSINEALGFLMDPDNPKFYYKKNP